MTSLNNGNQKDSNPKSVSKTLTILSTFNEVTPMQRTSDIATKLNMNISTVSRHLNTLLDMGFLERDDATGVYFLGMEVVSLAGAALQNNDVYRHTYPELQQLSTKFNVHSHMSVPRNKEIVHLLSASYESSMEFLIPMGHCNPMFCSAMGRAMLAYMPANKRHEILQGELTPCTPKTKIDPAEIEQELMKVRKKGYCIMIDELIENRGSLAAPIFDRNRNPIASVSVSENAEKMSQPQRQREMASVIVSVASKISGKLGYYPK
ncbi:IclR family transcriptional regulator [Chakrabartyella piscis]|uniref:IclR family transcriptional regulator n=1 Tax=Chakrabartyella piscis TaxID=2918914 RepID=UPI002958685E|nr:IclR family transcriptional regulator [Chakrabartyella piscis]